MTFDQALSFVTTYGYFFMFLVMMFEGPIITLVSAFAAALGYFNIYYVFGLAILGNLIPDLVFYAIGFWSRKSVIDKYHHFLGFEQHHIEKVEKLSENHVVKGLLFVKLIPFFAMPGLITAGALKIKFKKYFFWISVIIMCNSTFFLLTGYYFGSTYRSLEKYFNLKIYLISLLGFILIMIFYGYKKIISIAVKKIEK